MSDIPKVFAYVFEGNATARAIPVDQALHHLPGGSGTAFTWVHLDRASGDTPKLLAMAGLDRFVIDALTADETRPRCTVHGDGVLLNLRGVNLNPGAEPEDMISIRFWIEEIRVISVGLRPLSATGDMLDAMERQQAPATPGSLVAGYAVRLADRAEPTVAKLNERIDVLEEQTLDEKKVVERGKLANVRRSAIVLRRYMFPQRDALSTLEIEDMKWLVDRDRSRLREAAERVTRLGEELDAIRDRAQVVHDQIMDRRAETMNRQMLILSIVAALFLPLGMVTGLLGVNVGGIPGADNPWAFEILCAVLVVVGAAQVWLFKRIGLF